MSDEKETEQVYNTQRRIVNVKCTATELFECVKCAQSKCEIFPNFVPRFLAFLSNKTVLHGLMDCVSGPK